MPITIQCPCKGCKERHVGCHSSCEGYKDYRVKMDKYNDAKFEYDAERGSMFKQMEIAAKNFKNNSKTLKKKCYI